MSGRSVIERAHPRRRSRLAIAVALAIPVVTAFPGPALAQPETYEVIVDGHTPENRSAFLAYFPSELSVRPGDTIEFPLWDSGEPHTVTFGTVVEDAMTAMEEAMTAGTDPFADERIQRIPFLLTEEPGDANQVAANPCFVGDGDLPTDACFDAEQPAFEGTETFYNSGWLGADSSFSVTMSEDIAPGTYQFICLLHAPDMRGTITVVEEGAEVKAPDLVSEEAVAAIEEASAVIGEALDAAGDSMPQSALAGILIEELPFAMGVSFVPEDITVSVGDTVSWTIMGPHTVSFNASEEAIGPRVVAPDGTAHVNELAFAPSNSPGMPEPPEGEPDPNAPPVVIDAGEWDGTGFLSSGIILGFPPMIPQYSVTFTEAGTYTYNCLVHPDMRGTVTVVS